MTSRVTAILLFVLSAFSVAAQDPPATIDIQLPFGAAAAEVAQLQPHTDVSATPQNVATFTASDRTLTPKKAGQEQVTFTRTGASAPILIANVTVTPIPVQIVLKRDNKPVAFTDEATPVSVVSGDVLTLKVHQPGAVANEITFKKPVPSEAFVTTTDTTITFGALPNAGQVNPPPRPVTVTFETDDQVVHTLRFLVIEAIGSVRIDTPPVVREDTELVIPITVIGRDGGTYHSTSAEFSTSYSYECIKKSIAPANLIAVAVREKTTLDVERFDIAPDAPAPSPPVVSIQCTAKTLGREPGVPSDSAAIRIEASGGFIVFEPPSLNVVAGQAATVRARVFDRLGRRKDDQVTWSIVEQTDAAVLTAGAGNEASLLTLSDPSKLPETGLLTIRATLSNNDANKAPVIANLSVKITSPSGFTRVSGAIELLDYQTARDLYGSQTINDFYAAKITLLNDLQDEPDRKLVGASILVFSSSLAIGVNMEKTAADGNRPPRNDVRWEPVTFEDLRTLGFPMTYPIKSSRARPNPVVPRSHDLDNLPVYTCDDIWFAEQEVILSPQEESRPKDERDALRARRIRERDAQVAAARLRQLHYRPYPYDMVVKSFDPRDARSGRSWTFRALTFAGSVASFLTGVPNFKASNEFIAVNEKFGTILIPALAALWPSLKETQRQNLVSDTMHPIEEIPYASSLTKVVFLPKYPFQGFKRGYWFRISEVCPFNFQIDVAVAPKESRTTETVTAPNTGTQP